MSMRFFLATVRGNPAGYATRFSRNGMGHLEDLYTVPGHRNRGVGSNLILAIRASAVAEDDFLSLTTASTNDPAQRMYDRLGFDVLGTRGTYTCEISAAKTL